MSISPPPPTRAARQQLELAWAIVRGLVTLQTEVEATRPRALATGEGGAIAAAASSAGTPNLLELLLPPQDQLFMLPGGINDLGIANLEPDSDKLVRNFYPAFDPNPQVPGTGFAMQLALNPALTRHSPIGCCRP